MIDLTHINKCPYKGFQTVSFCITYCKKDYHMMCDLLKRLELQTDYPEEIIIVCSGISKKDLVDIGCVEIAGEYVPVKQIHSQKHLTAGQARNLCVEHSSCDILMYLDGDDFPHPQRIEIIRNLFSDKKLQEDFGITSIDMIVHSFTSEDRFQKYEKVQRTSLLKITSLRKNSKGKPSWLDPGDNLYNKGRRVAHGPVSIKKTCLESILWNDRKRGGDSEFCCDIFNAGHTIFHINLPLIYYSRVEGKELFLFKH
jgi:glycosyltransferase involved in cell wall biosynthesis